MSRLDTSQANTMAEAILDTLESEGGYAMEEIVAGLIQGVVLAAKRIASNRRDEEQILDEAANLLADGGVPDESQYLDR